MDFAENSPSRLPRALPDSAFRDLPLYVDSCYFSFLISSHTIDLGWIHRDLGNGSEYLGWPARGLWLLV